MRRKHPLGSRGLPVENPLPVVTEIVYRHPDGSRTALLVEGVPTFLEACHLRPKYQVLSVLRVWDRRLLLTVMDEGINAPIWTGREWL